MKDAVVTTRAITEAERNIMTLDRLDALETRIRDLVKRVQEVKKQNLSLSEEIKVVRQRLLSQEESNRHLEQERMDIQSRIERAIGDIELLDVIEEPEEVSL
jgi:FtsZ-binding cell division protein ZapB